MYEGFPNKKNLKANNDTLQSNLKANNDTLQSNLKANNDSLQSNLKANNDTLQSHQFGRIFTAVYLVQAYTKYMVYTTTLTKFVFYTLGYY